MTYTFRNKRPGSEFTMVPNAFARDRAISDRAKAFLLWFCSQPDQFEMSAARAREMAGCSARTWTRLREELAAAGALTGGQQYRDSNGQMRTAPYELSLEPWLIGGHREAEAEREHSAAMAASEVVDPPCAKNGVRPKKQQPSAKKDTKSGQKGTGHIKTIQTKARAPARAGETDHAKPSLETRWKEAHKRKAWGLDWVEPTSLSRMAPDQELKPLAHYQRLENLR